MFTPSSPLGRVNGYQRGGVIHVGMNRISRYLLLECAFSTLIALVVFTCVIMLPQLLRLVDLWVNKGVSVAILGHMTLLAMPQFLVAAIPMALLTGTLLALGRMAQESELIVLKACGISLYQMMRPIAILTVFCTLLSLLLTMFWLPYSFHQFSVLRKGLISATTLALKSHTFNQAVPGLTIYVDEQDAKEHLLSGILVHDQRKPDSSITLTARTGQIQSLPGGETLLFLQDGTRHQKVGENLSQDLIFSTYNMDLGIVLGIKTFDVKEKLDELSMGELRTLMQGERSESSYTARLEWHRRLSFPMATFILGLLAVSLGMHYGHRSGRSYGLVVAVLTLIVHFFLLSLGESLVRKHLLDPVIGFWLPNLLMMVLTGYVALLTHRGQPFPLAIWLNQSLASLPQRLLRSSAEESH